MTLQQIIDRHKGKEMPPVLKRKGWDAKKNYEFCYCSSGGNFYTTNDYEEPFPFLKHDLIADDWEYTENIWVSK